MVEAGVITVAQRDAAAATPVRVSRTLATQHAQYFVDWLDRQIRELVGEPTEDLVVETTLDLTLQTSAERAVRRILDRDEDKGVQQAALVALDGDGRVRAMIGGASYADSQFNRATEARRQAGSAFKPFVYLAALEAGYTPESRVVDQPITIGNWSPRNYSGNFIGETTLANAVAQSTNTIAAGMADQIGRDNVARAARRLGITSRIGLEPAMALGAVEVSPLEMAQAYDAFANGGRRVSAYGISRIRTPQGRVIYQRDARQGAPVQAISNPFLYYQNQMLRGVVTSGSGRSAGIAGRDIAGKTGTTSDYKDAWFVGYTGGFVTAVWVGKDDNTADARHHRRLVPRRHLARLHGGGPAAPERPGHPRRPRHARGLAAADARSARCWKRSAILTATIRRPRRMRACTTSPSHASGRSDPYDRASASPPVVRPTAPQPQRPDERQPEPRQPERTQRAAVLLAPHGVQGRAVVLEPAAVGAMVADQVVDDGPVGRAVVGVDQMGHLVGGQIVDHRMRGHDDAPAVADGAVVRAAGAPARFRVGDGDLHRTLPALGPSVFRCTSVRA